MEFLNSEAGIALIGAVVAAVLGVVLKKWKVIRAAAKASPNKVDDIIVEAVDDAAQEIVDSKGK